MSVTAQAFGGKRKPKTKTKTNHPPPLAKHTIKEAIAFSEALLHRGFFQPFIAQRESSRLAVVLS